MRRNVSRIRARDPEVRAGTDITVSAHSNLSTYFRRISVASNITYPISICTKERNTMFAIFR
jgi:hypothetical protein